jgi:adenylate kinase family enzyme
VIFLDLPRLVCLWRVLKRQIGHLGRERPELAPGCKERLSWEFLVWIWTYPSRRRGDILKRLAALDGEKGVVILESSDAIDEFLKGAGDTEGAVTP